MLNIVNLPNYIPDEYSIDVCQRNIRVDRRNIKDFLGKDVCLFVTLCPDGHIGKGISSTLEKIHALEFEIVICAVTQNVDQPIYMDSDLAYYALISRENGGLDFAIWAATLTKLPEIWSARRILFMNDSLIGPIGSLNPLITKIRASSADFIAITENNLDFHHAQSYFFVLNQNALQNKDVQHFWLTMPEYSSRSCVIRNCEHMQLPVYLAAGLTYKVLFPLTDITSQLKPEELQKFNPTHDAYKELMLEGFPFFKADLIYRRGVSPQLPLDLPSESREILAKQYRELMAARRSVTLTGYKKFPFIRKVIGDARFYLLRKIFKAVMQKRETHWP